jgi:hypothetical protein
VTDKPKPEVIHIVIGGGIVLAAYRDSAADSAEMHKRCMTGVSVQSVRLDDAPPEMIPLGATVHEVELLDHIPPEIEKDIYVEWDTDGEDVTPVTPKKSTKDDVKPLTIEDLDDRGDPER